MYETRSRLGAALPDLANDTNSNAATKDEDDSSGAIVDGDGHCGDGTKATGARNGPKQSRRKHCIDDKY